MLKNYIREVIGHDVYFVYIKIAHHAHNVVNRAIKLGQLPLLTNGKNRPIGQAKCKDCSRLATTYDHRDYLEPLVVEPVCWSCNRNRGPAIETLRRLRVNKKVIASIVNHVRGENLVKIRKEPYDRIQRR